ncbi:MAG: hypothetical protein AB7P76_06595 [Candidatus Melainabacteria bacterium]
MRPWAGLLVWVALLSYPLLLGIETDEGLYAAQGMRVANGQWPVSDFASAYPGLPVILLGGLFRLLGISFLVTKLYALLVFTGIAVMLYRWARQLLGDQRTAILSTALALLVSVPFHPQINPNWDALLWMLAATWFAHRSLSSDSRHPRRDGLLGGLAWAACLLSKQSLGILTGITLGWLILRGAPVTVERRERLGMVLSAATLILTLSIARAHPTLITLMVVVLPALWVSIVHFRSLGTLGTQTSAAHRTRAMSAMTIGAAGGLLLFLVLTTAHGHVLTWLNTLFWAGPQQHIGLYDKPYGFNPMAGGVLCLYLGGLRAFERKRLWLGAFAIGLVLCILVLTTHGSVAEMLGCAMMLLIWLPVAGLLLGSRAQATTPPEARTALLTLMLSGCWLWINCYPYFSFDYFAYMAPVWTLVILASLQSIGLLKSPARWVIILTLSVYGLFGLSCLYQVLNLYDQRIQPWPWQQYTAWYPLPHGGFFETPQTVQTMQTVSRTFQSLTRNLPDAENQLYLLGNRNMEYYALTGQANPTAVEYHSFSLGGDGLAITRGIEAHQTRYLCHQPQLFSHQNPEKFRLQPALVAYLHAHYALVGVTPVCVLYERSR